MSFYLLKKIPIFIEITPNRGKSLILNSKLVIMQSNKWKLERHKSLPEKLDDFVVLSAEVSWLTGPN